MNRFIDPSASAFWLIPFAIGWILVGAGIGIYYQYYRQHSVKQDNFYKYLAISGGVIAAVSTYALWP